jgi:hypothetical protein
MCKRTTFICHVVQRQRRQGLVCKCMTFIRCVTQRQQQQGLVRKRMLFSTSRRMMATTTLRKWLQQHHMSTTSPIAHKLFHIVRCAMATTTTRMATTPLFSTSRHVMAMKITTSYGIKHRCNNQPGNVKHRRARAPASNIDATINWQRRP